MKELEALSENERECTLRYLSILRERLDTELQQVWLFGSVARGDIWSKTMPLHSDIDLLVLTIHLVASEVAEELVNETYSLFLECGRQIAPQFRTLEDFYAPVDPRQTEFYEQVRQQGRVLYANP